ncbi:outer membrane receptor protein involved in Fe transport [Sphingomonas sp. BE123]|uniref:TonB-dependent receptor n=1 Tax=unclassified Sphingomonas TaxID=196159 RepID=UPI0028633ACD|nr:TonB-dependent receptor [Sphingomonas sp. BE123]MDR6853374.1 outer membrane receptor protein involved in Fe transport [Sphingomonas sp. BE123]
MRTLQLFSASALALIAATPAMAQDAPAPAAQDDAGYESANEVVITATRRNETVQDVPIAVTAVPATLLENAGIEDIRGLEQLAPSLQSSTGQSSATGTTLYIRGITTAGDNPGFEPAVGVFIDGVFRARAGVAVSDLPQLERVEILRGPQGTLFGRNTSAGALSIFTAQPAFDLGGYVEGSYGNYNAFELKGAVTGPVTEEIALRFDGGYRKRDGYIEDVNSDRMLNNVDRWYARGQALYDTSAFSLRLIADYYETDEQCCGAVSAVRGSLGPLIDGIAGAQGLDGLYTGDPSERRMAVSPNRDFSERVRDWGVSAEANFELGEIKLTSITAYRNWRALRNQDIDFSGIDRAYREGYRNRLSDFTQEIRFQGSAFGGALDWLVGGFYLNETNELRDTVRIGTDANRYVDSIFNALAGPSFGGSVQFYGSLGPSVPTPGAVFLNPAVPNALPALQAVYGAQLAPLVGCFRAQAGTAPSSLCVIPGFPSAPVPGLAALAASPLPGGASGQGNNDDNFRVKTNAFALFTHNLINLSDKLTLTLGARWNYEKKDLSATINSNTGSCTFFNQVRTGNPAAVAYANVLRQVGLFNNLFLLSCNPAVNSEFNGSYTHDQDESKITGTAKLAYKITPDVLLYGGYDRGYKSGGYNMDQATFDSVLLGGNGAQGSDLAFGSESVDAFEIGLKTQWGRAFTFNIAGFYQKFSNLQSLVFSGTNFVVQNVDSTTSKGVEVESIIQPVRDFTVRLGYSYIDAQYDADNNFVGTPLQGQEGRQVSNQPKHTVTMATTWTPSITSNIRGLVHVDMRYNSEVNIPSNNPNPVTGRTVLYNPGYPLISARLGVQTEDSKKSLEFFVENLTNQYYHVTGFAVPEQNGNFAAYPGLPRFYGVRAKIGF